MSLTNLAKQITGEAPSEPVETMIEKTAKAVADAGIPDDLNRWKDMTPAKLAENEKAREKMRKSNGKVGPKERKLAADRAKKSNEPGVVGGLTEKDKANIAALKKEAAQAAKEKTEKRIAALKAAKVEKKAVKAAAKAGKKGHGAGISDPGPKAAKAEKPAGEPRKGSKAAIIGDLLKRKEGCTTADVLTATGWPAVSMPQQAKMLGVELRKEKQGTTTRYWAA